MGGVLINRLLNLLNETSADATYHHVAQAMLAHIEEIEHLGIHEMAECCAVSKSTISKFIRELGYRDYADFRYAVGFDNNRYRAPHTFVHDVLGYLKEHTCEEYARVLARDMIANTRSLDEQKLEQLAEDIVSHDSVAAFGLMFSETAAMDLQIKLGRIGKFIVTSMNDLKQFEYIRQAGPDTLIIVFSESGTFPDRYEMTDPETRESVFRGTGAKVVMVTANRKMAQDFRLDYIVSFNHSGPLHTHRVIYPILTDIITFKCYELLQRK